VMPEMAKLHPKSSMCQSAHHGSRADRRPNPRSRHLLVAANLQNRKEDPNRALFGMPSAPRPLQLQVNIY